MRTWPSIAVHTAIIALAVAGCDSYADDENLGETEQGVVSVVSCYARGSRLDLYQGPNYTGAHLCLAGDGKYVLTGSWYHGIRSYKTGPYNGLLSTDTILPPQPFGPGESVPSASAGAQYANVICMTAPMPDAGPHTCP
jgi:hypothetical protein